MKMKNTTLEVLFCGALLLLVGCEVDIEEKGELPSVDVEGDSGQLPRYEVEKTQEGQLPSVDVDADRGKLPEVDVRGPDVDVGTDAVAVPVPEVDIDLPEEKEPASTTQ